MILLLTLALSCPETKTQNVSGFPWNKRDQEVLVGAQKRCGELYPEAPCLKLLRKYGEHDYSAVCGAKQ